MNDRAAHPSSEWSGDLEALDPEALVGVDLPAATKERLISGVPREVRLPGWLGPTVFSSELRPGHLSTLRELSSLGDHALARAFVIGAIRETSGPPSTYAVFCVLPPGGEVWLVETEPPHRARFVNAGLGEFLRCVGSLFGAWTRMQAAAEDEVPALASELRNELHGIDARADKDDSYWPTWLETILEG